MAASLRQSDLVLTIGCAIVHVSWVAVSLYRDDRRIHWIQVRILFTGTPPGSGRYYICVVESWSCRTPGQYQRERGFVQDCEGRKHASGADTGAGVAICLNTNYYYSGNESDNNIISDTMNSGIDCVYLYAYQHK